MASQTIHLVVVLVICEGISVLFYCAAWWWIGKHAGSVLENYIAFGVLIGFLAFVITALLLSRYGINYFIQAAIVLVICFFMLNSKLMDGLIKKRQ